MKDKISAFMDGELDDKAAGELIDILARDRDALDSWRTYHLISDALRDSRLLSEDFTARVARQLAHEPTVVAPRVRLQPHPRTWYAIAASLAAVALVGWLGFGPQEGGLPQVAQVPPSAARPDVSPKPTLVPLPSGTNDYLLAHQGFSPRVSLQGMAPYVRTVSEQGQEPRR